MMSRSVHLKQRYSEPRRDEEQGVELGSHSRMDCLAAELFLNGCFSDIVFVTLFRTAVETAISGVYRLLCTDVVNSECRSVE